MHRRRLMFVALVAAVLCGAAALRAGAATPTRSTLPGTWTGSYTGSFSGTFTIRWRLISSRLVGTIHLSNPPGNYGITGAVQRGGGIKFGVVDVGANYSGSVSGKSMSGKYSSPQGGRSWSAHKTS
jgi:hypothetical protein